jgi:hypothetical protein
MPTEDGSDDFVDILPEGVLVGSRPAVFGTFPLSSMTGSSACSAPKAASNASAGWGTELARPLAAGVPVGGHLPGVPSR